MLSFLQIITYASLGGILPCLFWLVFWLREDSAHPEPKRVIMACFVAGMLTTLLVLPFEALVSLFFKSPTTLTYILWAALEEVFKFAVCYFVAIRTVNDDEPIDSVIYMIVVALGFAALENSFYLISPLATETGVSAAINGNLRFIGSTLLHTVSSGTVGIFLAFSFYKSSRQKEQYAFLGLIAATVLHTLFNLFILEDSGKHAFMVFVSVWLLIIGLIVIVEKIKKINI